MKCHNPAAQGQPQTGASLLTGAGFVHHVKGLRNLVELLFRHTAAIVADSKPVPFLLRSSCYGDFSLRRKRLSGIVHQINKQGQK